MTTTARPSLTRLRAASAAAAACLAGGALTAVALVSPSTASAATPRIDPGTVLVSGSGISTIAPGGTTTPFGADGFAVAVDTSGDVYALDDAADPQAPPAPGQPWVPPPTHYQVTEYPADGSAPTVIGRGRSVTTPVTSNGGVAVDALGNVYWNDNLDNTTWKIAAGTRVQTAVATGFRGLGGLAVDPSGTLYIAEYGQGRLWRSTGYGTGPATVVASDTGSGQGVAVDASGAVYLSEQDRGTVIRIAPDGSQSVVASGMTFPEGVALDSAANLIVVDSGGPASPYGGSTDRVLSVPLLGGPTTTLATTPWFTYMVAVYTPASASFTAANPPAGSYGTGYHYDFATGAPAGSASFGLRSGSLPPGLALDPATGALSGVPTSVGTYRFTVTSTVGGTVAIAPTTTVVIAPAPLRVTIRGTRTFGGTASLTVTAVDGLLGGDSAAVVTGSPTCRTLPPVTADVGTYVGSIRNCSGLVAANYAITYADAGFTVTPAPATVTVTGAQPFGGTPTFAVSAVTGASSVTGTLTGCTTTTAVTAPAGTYPGTISGCGGLSAGSDYTVAYADGGYTVAPAGLTATVVGRATYGGHLAFTVTGWSGLINGDTPASAVTGSLTGCQSTAAGDDAGTYASSITGCSGLGAGNYSISYRDGGTIISPAPLSIVASSGSSTYGDLPSPVTGSYARPAADTRPSLGTPPTCSTVAAATSPVGTYATACAGAADANYTITYVDGSQRVTAAPLSVAVAGTSRYGNAAVSFSVGTYSGLRNGDTGTAVSGTLTSCASSVTAGTGVGTVTASITGCAGLSAPNYAITYTDAGVSVGPAPLTVTASSAQVTYGQAPSPVTASYSGLVAGDTAASLGAPTCGTTATATSPAGTYPTVCSGVAAPNYVVGYLPGSITIVPATTAISYTGPSQLVANSTVVLTAAVKGPGACAAGQQVTFTSDSNPVTGAAGAYPLGTATTDATGTATAPVVHTTGWTVGARTVTVSTAGTSSCAAASAATPVAVVGTGQVAVGAGTYASAAGVSAFSLAALAVPGTTGKVVGGVSIVTARSWWFTGAVTTYTKTATNGGVLSGTGTISSWSATANHGHGGWVPVRSGVSFVVSATATSRTAPAAIGVQLGCTAPAGSAPLPTTTRTTVRSGTITLA